MDRQEIQIILDALDKFKNEINQDFQRLEEKIELITKKTDKHSEQIIRIDEKLKNHILNHKEIKDNNNWLWGLFFSILSLLIVLFKLFLK